MFLRSAETNTRLRLKCKLIKAEQKAYSTFVRIEPRPKSMGVINP